jgi:stage II sporulation protein R
MSLRVILGKGSGKNWWCVMFPPLCVPVADNVEIEKDKLGEYLTPSGQDVVKGKDKYVFKFKILEIYEELKQKTVID